MKFYICAIRTDPQGKVQAILEARHIEAETHAKAISQAALITPMPAEETATVMFVAATEEQVQKQGMEYLLQFAEESGLVEKLCHKPEDRN